MTPHEGTYPLGILEVRGMAHLVDLVRTDLAHPGVGQVELEIALGGGQEGYSVTGVGDLGGRGELQDAIRVASLLGHPEHRQRLDLVVGEMVQTVGVVPPDAEVGSGRHLHEATHGLLVVDGTVGIGVHRHDPHALDLRIRGQPLHLVHVGAVLTQLDGKHLDAQVFAQREMTIVAGDRGDELDLLIGPTALRPWQLVQHGEGEEVVHEGQAGVVTSDDVLEIDVEQLGEDLPDVDQTAVAAVVSHIGAIGGSGGHVHVEHVPVEVELLGSWLAPGDVEVELLGDELGVQAALLVQDVLEFLGRHLRQIGGHGVIFPHCVPCPTFGLPGGTA